MENFIWSKECFPERLEPTGVLYINVTRCRFTLWIPCVSMFYEIPITFFTEIPGVTKKASAFDQQ